MHILHYNKIKYRLYFFSIMPDENFSWISKNRIQRFTSLKLDMADLFVVEFHSCPDWIFNILYIEMLTFAIFIITPECVLKAPLVCSHSSIFVSCMCVTRVLYASECIASKSHTVIFLIPNVDRVNPDLCRHIAIPWIIPSLQDSSRVYIFRTVHIFPIDFIISTIFS